MKNIDAKLIDWAVHKIETEYPDDVALLIGQVGACKTPEDQQSMAFDFFIPSTDKGYQLAQTFIIEDMGYDLYPISWERLQGIVDLREPSMIFAFMKGEVIYARSKEDRKRYYDMKKEIQSHLDNIDETFPKVLEYLGTAMEIYQTMMFEESLGTVRKAAGGISCFLTHAIAIMNGQYLKNGYGNLTFEMEGLTKIPDGFKEAYEKILKAKTIEELQNYSHQLIKVTRDYLVGIKGDLKTTKAEESIVYEDLADWYYEARYTFRKIAYYAKHKSVEDCFLLGCYLQIEFDAICGEFNLGMMDLLGSFQEDKLDEFAKRADNLEKHIVDTLKEHRIPLKIYNSFEEFAK